MSLFSYRKNTVDMVECGYPSAYVVNSHVTRPTLPPRLNQGRRHGRVAQTLLFLLVGLALCGMVIEACFIYHLHHSEAATSAISSKLTTGEDIAPTKRPRNGIRLPSKPVAHLTDGQDVVHDEHIMAWSMNADPLLHEMKYKDRSLIIQKEGYYFVYSKVFFSDSGKFDHFVKMCTEKYSGRNITLLQSRKYSPVLNGARSNSYLGGVFYFGKNDALFVSVSSTAKLSRHKAFENVFGAYMI